MPINVLQMPFDVPAVEERTQEAVLHERDNLGIRELQALHGSDEIVMQVAAELGGIICVHGAPNPCPSIHLSEFRIAIDQDKVDQELKRYQVI